MKSLFTFGLLGLALVGCGMGSAAVDLKTDHILPPDLSNPADNPAPLACDFGYSYQGFGGTRLEAGRTDEEEGFDRDRVKPYDALLGEYARVLGSTPTLLNEMGSTFGLTPARWYIEPQATAVSLFASLRVAFAGCVNFTSSSDYDAAPDASTAAANCGAFANRFWSRAPDTDELQSCVDLVMTGTATEADPHRKWAYACASVLSAAPFLTF